MEERSTHAEPEKAGHGRIYVVLRDDMGRIGHYDLTRLREAGPGYLASWRWIKVDPTTGEKLKLYTTHRSAIEGKECCTCDGFGSAGRCKHVRFLRSLGVFGPHAAEVIERERRAFESTEEALTRERLAREAESEAEVKIAEAVAEYAKARQIQQELLAEIEKHQKPARRPRGRKSSAA